MWTTEEVDKNPWWWIRNRRKIIDALDIIDLALEEYDEGRGLAFSDIPEKFKDIQDFFNDVCYPDDK